MKKARAAAFAVAAIALVTGILLIPTPLRIQGTLVLKLAKPEEVYAEVEGRLVELNVKNGDWVKKDTVLAKLSNPEKQKELLQRQQDQTSTSHKAQWFDQSAERENRAQAKHTRGVRREARADHRQDHRADRQADLGRQPRRPGRRVASPGDRRPVAQAGQAVLRDRRPPQARGAPDPRSGRHSLDHSSIGPPGSRSTAGPRRPQGQGRRDRQAEPRRDPHRAVQHGRGRGRLQARSQDRRGQAADGRLRGDHPDGQPRPRARARPPRLRQDRRRHLHPGLVALCGGGTSCSTSSSDRHRPQLSSTPHTGIERLFPVANGRIDYRHSGCFTPSARSLGRTGFAASEP